MQGVLHTPQVSGALLEVSGEGIYLARGITVPSDATAGYVTGALFIHTDGGDGTALYVNEGTKASCDFNALNGA